jgi:altronate dehydratase
MANAPLPLDSVSRLPAPNDNVAIAIRRIEAGEVLAFAAGPRAMPHTVLEGHRFAVRPIAVDEPLLSWGLPFGHAIAALSPGDYVCNRAILEALAVRRLERATLPATPNFRDSLEPFRLDESTIRASPPVERVDAPRTFSGFRRPGRRGVGTRNFIVVVGTTSRTASFARQLVARLKPLARVHPNLDGIVAVAHTEGGGPGEPNNTAEILRALAGFLVHPNVAAVLAVDYGVEPITNVRLRDFMREHRYPLEDVPHHFLTLREGLSAGLAEGERIVRSWLPAASALRRTAEPLSGLRVALQCGGSDAFSGVSGNPLAGAVVHELIRHGGTGVMTETDESMGAEGYMLANVPGLPIARQFMRTLNAFREKLTWHGLTPESNPSAGNRFRGLYNIALKSLGAVHKKDPRTRLDTIIHYAQPLAEIPEPGFTFMNGPGNDLEGIAGQVGAGCNLIIFVTGNGSVTNFPFVPTLKITTTTRRHNLLIHEMDINAGRYLDGESMPALTADAFELLVATASGQKTKGEHAGHSQMSLWRNWRQTDTSRLEALRARVAPDGIPLKAAHATGAPSAPATPVPLTLVPSGDRFATERIGLVLPTSLCAGQIARIAAERMNAKQLGREQGISRFVALAHTEGCGFGGETMYQLLQRTYRGYLRHPNVAAALLLEHGCEKVPNDIMRRQLDLAGMPLGQFGWASVQLDGGMEKAIGNIERWFSEKLAATTAVPASVTDLGALAVGLITVAPVRPTTARALASVATAIIAAGGSVVLPEGDPLLALDEFRGAVFGGESLHATLAYGQPIEQAGLHVVASETDHPVENITGFGGNGVHVAVVVVADHAQPGHPLVPVIQIAEPAQRGVVPADDIDFFLSGDTHADERAVTKMLVAVAQRETTPVANAQGFVDFQLTRGELGLTT